MGTWTLRHRIRWFVDHVRRRGLSEIRRRLQRYTTAQGRAAAKRRRDDATNFDAAHAYQTNEIIALDDLSISSDTSSSRHYEATPVYDINSSLELLDLPTADTTFVDIGCGMGRPLLIAADLPFKRVVGVEFARELLDIAAQNFARRALGRGPDDRIELICSDATLMPIPDGPVAFFFCNSFGPPALGRLLQNIHTSWRENPRPIRFIYMNVQHPEAMESAKFRQAAVASNYQFIIYEPT